MTVARLRLTGIRAEGHHGARPGEKDDAQSFVVDLELDVDVAADQIDATADYRGVSETVRAVIVDRSFDLIEVMAAEIAEIVLAMPHVAQVTLPLLPASNPVPPHSVQVQPAHAWSLHLRICVSASHTNGGMCS